MRRTALLGLFLMVGLGLAPGCDRGGQRSSPPVVLILVDAWRADFAGAYGEPGQITPSFDRLCRRGTLFRRVVTSYTVTHLAVGSLLSSRWYPLVPGQLRPMVSQALAGRGYRTAAFHRNPTLQSIGAAWDEQFQENFLAADYTWKGIRPLLWPWLAGTADRPFFAYVHYMDVHIPYQPRPPLDRLYPSPGVHFEYHNGTIENHSPASLASGRAACKASVRDWDMHLAELMDYLDELGIFEDSLIVVMADHGDEFGEHGFVGHGHAVYQETAEVPLLIVQDGKVPAGRIVDGLVRTIDLVPTLLDLLGEPALEGQQGESLKPAMAAGAPIPFHVAFTQGREFGCPRARRTGKWTLVEPAAGERRLFQPLDDPGERVDQASGQPLVASRDGQELERWFREEIADELQPSGAGPPGSESLPNPADLESAQGEVREELRALGYLK